MKNRLTAKVLLTTLSTFALLVTIIVFSQVYFFNNYYEKAKIDSMNSQVDHIRDQMLEGNENHTIYLLIKEFEENQNGVIITNYFDLGNDFVELPITDGTFEYTLYIENFDFIQEFENQDDMVEIEGVFFKSILIPISINGVQTGLNPEGERIISDYTIRFSTIGVLEIASSVGVISETEGIEISPAPIIFYGGDTSQYENHVQIRRDFMIDEESKSIVALGSLQPVDEALGIMSSFYVYFYIIAGIIALIISYFFTNLITRPVIKLNDVATSIKNQDFTIKTLSTRKDELGQLANSLDAISTNLGTVLEELKTTNIKLTEKYDNQLKIIKNREEFIQNISHELKTPLGIIKSYAEGVYDNINKDKTEEYLSIITDEVDRMNSMILSMINTSLKKEKLFDYDFEEVSLDTLVKSVSELFSIRLLEKQLSLKVSGETKTSLVDTNKIKQVIINLLDNAIKYSYENSVIRIDLSSNDTHNIVRIENSCNQLDEESIKKIWERHYKENTQENSHGLGLSISKNILLDHNAEFGADLTESGVVFYFKLTVV